MTNSLKIIRTKKQYYEYCDLLEDLLKSNDNKDFDDIELLTLLIRKWDDENLPKRDTDPIQLIKALMSQNHLKAIDLSKILEVNKSTVSRILNYQKSLSKKSIRVLSNYFCISQEALNKPYKLKSVNSKKIKDASLIDSTNAKNKVKQPA